MDAKLLANCETFLDFRTKVVKKLVWDVAPNDEAIMGAFLHISANKDFDTDYFKTCKDILKRNAGLFSEFRGYSQNMVIFKMMLSKDPEDYLKGALEVYHKLRNRHKLTASPFMVMAALTIYEKGGVEKSDEYIDELEELYSMLKKEHPIIINDEDRGYLSMLVTAGVTGEAASTMIEECYLACKNITIDKDAVHQMAQILALSSKPIQEKTEFVRSMMAALKEKSHSVSKSYGLAALASLTLIDMPMDELVEKICETADYLKGKKGFIMCGAHMRTLYACLLVLLTYTDEQNSRLISSISGTLTMQIIEQIVMMLITTTAVASATASSSGSN